MAVLKTLTINGTVYQVTQVVAADSITLSASKWQTGENNHSQVVEVTGVASTTKVNLQPTLEQLEIFRHKELAFTIANRGGVVTVYAIGDKPTNDYTIQITRTEVEGDAEVIWGDTVGTPMPRSNLEQTDPTKADYILGRDVWAARLAGLENGGTSMTTFDLVSMGLPVVDVGTGVGVNLYMDTAKIKDALQNDITQCVVPMYYNGITVNNAMVTFFPSTNTGLIAFLAHPIFVNIEVYDDHITVSGKLAVLNNIPPIVSTDDNGKFLRVVDGAWAAVAVGAAEEASF